MTLQLHTYFNNDFRVDDPSSWNILCYNIRSLRNKLTDVTDFILNLAFRLHIIILNETWVSENDKNFFNLPGFTAYHSTRQKLGGGVAIYVNNSFSDSCVIEACEIDNCNFLTIKLLKLKHYIVTAYRPPSSNITHFLNKLNELLKFEKTFFYGDTNIDLFKPCNNALKLKDIFF